MSALDAAWQAALATEQQAVFGYGLLGPRLAAVDQPFARACSVAHEQRRDAVVATLTSTGLVPVAPLADYPSLYPVPDAAAARAVALRVEDACAASWRYLYLRAASTVGPTFRPTFGPAARRARSAAQDGLVASAIRAGRWRSLIDPARGSVPFPGL